MTIDRAEWTMGDRGNKQAGIEGGEETVVIRRRENVLCITTRDRCVYAVYR